jgi:hypothetical protein
MDQVEELLFYFAGAIYFLAPDFIREEGVLSF